MTAQSDTRPTILLTRPEAASRRCAAEIAARFGEDLPVLIAPLMEIVALPAEIPPAREVNLTSQNAVAPVVARSPAAGRRAYCVGGKTAAAARRAGFETLEGQGDARGLLPLIRAQHRGGGLVHARGEEVAVPLADLLNSAEIETKEVVVYRQQACALEPAIRAQLARAGLVVAPLFSPRSADRLVQELGDWRGRIWVAAISATVAERAGPLRPERLEVAERPDLRGVLEALTRLIGPAKAG